MQDCARAWLTAVQVPSVQVNGVTVRKHDSCCNCRIATDTLTPNQVYFSSSVVL